MSGAGDLAALRHEIVSRHGSVHRFCRAHRGRLNRSTVYMVLSGRHGGNVDRQAARIQDALDGRGREARMFEAIKAVACARCTPGRKDCTRCDDLFQDQARAAGEAVNGH